MNPDTQGTKQ